MRVELSSNRGLGFGKLSRSLVDECPEVEQTVEDVRFMLRMRRAFGIMSAYSSTRQHVGSSLDSGHERRRRGSSLRRVTDFRY